MRPGIYYLPEHHDFEYIAVAGGQFLQWNLNGGTYTNDGTGEYFYNADNAAI